MYGSAEGFGCLSGVVWPLPDPGAAAAHEIGVDAKSGVDIICPRHENSNRPGFT